VGRARTRVVEIEKRYPSASQRERAQRLIDAKKSLASAIGGVTGACGLVGITGELLVMSWLQIALVVGVDSLYKVNLKGTRARNRVVEIEKRYPSASQRERAQRLIDAKKSLASAIGGVTGAFGLVGIPGDLLVMSWLQIALVVDVATLYKVNLKGTRARNEVL